MSVGLFVWQVGGKQRTHIRSILGQRVYSVYSAHGALTTFFQQILSHHWLFSNAPIATGHLRWSISTKLIRMDRCPVKHGWIFRFRSLHPRLISLDSRPRWTWKKIDRLHGGHMLLALEGEGLPKLFWRSKVLWLFLVMEQTKTYFQ